MKALQRICIFAISASAIFGKPKFKEQEQPLSESV